MVATVRQILTFLTVLGLLSSAGPLAAETIRQSVGVLGWTNSGSELVTSVTLEASGIDSEGDPVEWTYSVIEVRNARSGKVLNRYQVGAPPSVAQRGWDAAKTQAAGRAFLENVGVAQTEDNQVSSDGTRVVVDATSFDTQAMGTISDASPGCNECTTRLELTLVDGTSRASYQLPAQTRTGNPFAPGDANHDCPKLGVRAYWHPSEPRLAVVLTEEIRSTGALLESVRAYDLDKDASGWKSTPLAAPSSELAAARAAAEEERLRSLLADTQRADKAAVMCDLGDHLRRAGDIDAAAGYYASALAFDKKSLRAQLGQAHVLAAKGDDRKARQLARKVEAKDRRAGALNVELGLFRIAIGDIDGAQSFLQAAVDGGDGADRNTRLRLGLQILDADLSAGLAYLDNLFGGLDSDTVDADLVQYASVRAAEGHIHLRDLGAAAAYLKWLDPKGADARRLALLLGALRSGDPSRMTPILEGVDALLAQTPGACGLYYVKGMAFLRLTQPRDAYVHLAAALACDPSLEEAHYYLADMYRFAGQLEASRRHYTNYLALAPERRGDDARTLRRGMATTMVPRMEHTGVVLLRWECSPKGDLSCKGVLFNSSPAPSGPVEVSLTATIDQRRKVVTVGNSTATVPEITPGQSVNFEVRIQRPEPGARVELDAGRSEVEREVNRTGVTY